MVKWAFEYDEVSLLFPFKLPSFHTLSREKKNTLNTNFQKQNTFVTRKDKHFLPFQIKYNDIFFKFSYISCMHGLGIVTDNDKLQPTRDNAKSANSNSKTNAMFGNGRREEKRREK